MTVGPLQGQLHGRSRDGSHNESQPSQILDFVLGSAAPTGTHDNKVAQNASVERPSAPVAEASVSSSSSGSVPRYHFHGLAATQTQSQYAEDGPHEDSQKENTPTESYLLASHPPSTSKTPSIDQSSNAPQAACVTPSRAAGIFQAGPLSTRRPLQEAPPHKGAKGVTFLSPVYHPSPINTAQEPPMRFRRRRSPSPASQDSFAGPSALQDPDLFLATSKQFERPLDELGQTSSQESTSSAEPLAHGRPVEGAPGQKLGNRSTSQMTPYSLSSHDSARLGRVLVANSDESGQSQGSSASDNSIDHRQAESFYNPGHLSQQATQIISHSDQSGSSQASLPSNEPTQIIGESSQLERELTLPLDLHSAPAPFLQTSTGNASERSNATSILALIPPEKRHRYMHAGINLQPRYAPVPAGTSSSRGVGSTLATLATSSEHPPRDQRRDGRDGPGAHRTLDTSSLPSKPLGRGSGTTEVIPDSEIQVETQKSGLQSTRDSRRSREEVEEVIPASEPDHIASTSGEFWKAAAQIEEEVGEREEDEEDIPLAKILAKPVSAISTSKEKPKPKPQVASKTDVRAGNVTRQDTTVVPSSAPHQDTEEAKPVKPQKSDVKKGQKTATSKTAPSRGRRGRPPSKGARSSKPPPNLSEEEAKDSETESETSLLEQQEVATEIADDEDNEVEDESFAPSPGPLRKRKRAASAAQRPISKVSKSGKSLASASSTRSIKRAKTLPAGAGNPAGATRVFALWKADGHYYAGTIHSAHKDSWTKYLVKFDDSTEDVVDISQMRVCRLQVGDEVLLLAKKRKAKVIGVDQWASDLIVRVQFDDGVEDTSLDIDSAALRIAGRTLMAQWKTRTLTADDIVLVVGRKLKETPSPSRLSVMSGVSTRAVRNKILAKTAFVITLRPGHTRHEDEKENLVRTVKETGGMVINDWTDIFSISGKHVQSRWTIQKGDVKFASSRDGIERVFLLADEFSTTPKFLMALALGIPCVSVEWLERCAQGDECPWQSFLLPAGYSDPLSARVSQMVDLDWGNSLDHLRDIISNPVPQKPLDSKNVLCVGSSLMPVAKVSTDEASQMVPRIILAMGASRVDAVVNIKNAQPLTSYHYVVVIDDDLKLAKRGQNFVNVHWIKQCLIAGRLLPLP